MIESPPTAEQMREHLNLLDVTGKLWLNATDAQIGVSYQYLFPPPPTSLEEQMARTFLQRVQHQRRVKEDQ